MAVCDLCGKEYDNPGEKVVIYATRLLEHQVTDKHLLGTKTATKYSHFTPVTFTICQRHRRELFLQRLMPGLFSFLIVFPIIAFVISLLYHFQGVWLRLLYGITFVISIGIALWVVRLISMDGLVATGASNIERQKGTAVEYVPARKYLFITQGSQKPGLLNWMRKTFSFLIPGNRVDSLPSTVQQTHRSKKNEKSKRAKK
jgi:hypothetical protein